MLLAIETATNVCSVAFRDEDGHVHEKRTEQRGSHSEKLFLFIEELAKEHGFTLEQLQAVLISEGPGSYTGLRIGASAVKGLLFQSSTPLYGVNTLASFARAAVNEKPESERVHSIIDARRVHVYHQQFSCDSKVLTAATDVEVIPIEKFEGMVREGDVIAGTGLKRLEEKTRVGAHVYDQRIISARSLLQLFEEDSEQTFVRRVSADEFEPHYYTSRQVKK